MARKMKRFASGGSTDRYNRKIADIESDYQKALKSGKAAGVAKAKYEQRMADAKDDLAKWTGADRTASRAAEKASEAALSEARRTKGMSIERRDSVASRMAELDKPIETKRPSTSDIASSVGKAAVAKPKPKVRPAAAPKPMARRDATPAPKKDTRASDRVFSRLPSTGGLGAGAKPGTLPKPAIPAPFNATAARAVFDKYPTPKPTAVSTAPRRATVDEVRTQTSGAGTARKMTPEQERKLREAVARSGTRSSFAKGGSINGIAKRGLTRAKMKGSK